VDLFERAARRRLRFPTQGGIFSVEDLFQLDLVSSRTNKPSLDRLAIEVHRELKTYEEISFVETTKPNERKTELQLQFDILKYIIEAKKAEALAAENREKKRQLKNQLIEALASKQDDAIKSMSAEEIQAKLNELEAV
jgi:hypothetical protein